MKAIPFEETVLRELRDDPEFAAAYLRDALEESEEEFYIALRKYIQGHGGIAKIAQAAGVTREAAYRMLSRDGNPAFRHINEMARIAGMRITFEPIEEANVGTTEPELIPA